MKTAPRSDAASPSWRAIYGRGRGARLWWSHDLLLPPHSSSFELQRTLPLPLLQLVYTRRSRRLLPPLTWPLLSVQQLGGCARGAVHFAAPLPRVIVTPLAPVATSIAGDGGRRGVPLQPTTDGASRHTRAVTHSEHHPPGFQHRGYLRRFWCGRTDGSTRRSRRSTTSAAVPAAGAAPAWRKHPVLTSVDIAAAVPLAGAAPAWRRAAACRPPAL